MFVPEFLSLPVNILWCEAHIRCKHCSRRLHSTDWKSSLNVFKLEFGVPFMNSRDNKYLQCCKMEVLRKPQKSTNNFICKT